MPAMQEKLSLLGRAGFVGPSVGILLFDANLTLARFSLSVHATWRQGTLGGIVRREGWVVVGVVKAEGWRGGPPSGGGQGTLSAPLLCPSVIVPTSSVHGSIVPTLKRSGAQRSRVTSANPRRSRPLQFCPSSPAPQLFGPSGGWPCRVFNGTPSLTVTRHRTTNACVSGPPLFQTAAPPPNKGSVHGPVDSTTVADTKSTRASGTKARVPHDLG